MATEPDLETALKNLLTEVGTQFKIDRAAAGTLASLTTAAKGNLVVAINEVQAAVQAAATSGGAPINDGSVGASTTYSSQKTADLLAQLKTDILGGAGAAWDTLQELKDLDGGAIDVLTTAVGNRVRFDAAQTLTATQKTQALTNIGAVSTAVIGDPTVDLVALFQAALV